MKNPFKAIYNFILDLFKRANESAGTTPAPAPKPTPKPTPVPDPVPAPPKVEEPRPIPKPEPQPTPEPTPPSKVEVPVPAPPVVAPPVKNPESFSFRGSSIIMGVASKEQLIKTDEQYKAFLKKVYRSLTPENAAKWGHVHPDINKWSTGDMDALLAFANSNSMRVHGHCLTWGVGVPDYLKKITSLVQLERCIRDHFYGMVDKFGKTVRAWDVTNEALGDNGSLKSTFFYDKFGEEMVPLFFDIAHQADPTAELFFSDYGLEGNSARTPGLLKLLDKWLKAGVPIHGISSQMHTVQRLNLKTYNENLKKFAATGLKFHISELDVRVDYGQTGKTIKDEEGKVKQLFPFTPELKALSATTYDGIVSGYKVNMPEAQQYGITAWSVTHKQSSINLTSQGKPNPTDYPALFADDYTPEPAAVLIAKQ